MSWWRSAFNEVNAWALDELKQHWPDVENHDKNWFWKHEWDKHGKCATNKFDSTLKNQLDYFKKGLELKSKFSIYKLIYAIYENNNGGYYSTKSIIQTVKHYSGSVPSLQCDQYFGNNSDSNIILFYLKEIKICMDKSFNQSYWL